MQQTNVVTVSPREAKSMMESGVALLDVREYPEWLECHIPGATHIPLGELKSDPQRGPLGPEVITLCRSGKRATEAAQVLAHAGATKVFVIQGGLEAWKAAGLATQRAEGGPISLERQVRIGAGALVLLGLLVPRLRVVSWFVPCGLIFAGITDWCGMAKMLANAPWNRSRGDKDAHSCNLGGKNESETKS